MVFIATFDVILEHRVGHTKLFILVRHRNLDNQPKRAITSIENVFAFFEKGYIVHN